MSFIGIIPLLIPIIPSCIIGYIVRKIVRNKIIQYSTYYTNSLDWVAYPCIGLLIALFSYVLFMDAFFLVFGLLFRQERETFVGIVSLLISILLLIWCLNRLYAVSHAMDHYYLIKILSPKDFKQVDENSIEINLKSNYFGNYFKLVQYGQLVGIIDRSYLFDNKDYVIDFLQKNGHTWDELKKS